MFCEGSFFSIPIKSFPTSLCYKLQNKGRSYILLSRATVSLLRDCCCSSSFYSLQQRNFVAHLIVTRATSILQLTAQQCCATSYKIFARITAPQLIFSLVLEWSTSRLEQDRVQRSRSHYTRTKQAMAARNISPKQVNMYIQGYNW